MSRKTEMSDEYLNPFERAPWPNMIRIGWGEGQDLHTEIKSDGTIEFYDDPLGTAVLTWTPDDADVVGFFAAHLGGFAEEWEKTGRAAYEEKMRHLSGGHSPRSEADGLTCDGLCSADECPDSETASGCIFPHHRSSFDPPWGLSGADLARWRSWQKKSEAVASGYAPSPAPELPAAVPMKQPAATVVPRQQVLVIDGVTAVRREAAGGDD